MLARRFSMAFESLFTKIANMSAYEFFKFLLSVASGLLIFILISFFTSDENTLHYIISLVSSLCCGLILFLRNWETSVDENAASEGFDSQKRRARRDGDDDDDSSNATEPPDGSSESNTSAPKESPLAPEPSRKNTRRQKKKRNSLKSNKSKFKGVMDDSSETSSVIDTHPRIITHVVEKTKVYKPLTLYLKMNLELYDIYYEFKPYLLTPDQLRILKFPLESSESPGHIIPDPNLKKGTTERRCCRCGNSFFIQADGMYEADSTCQYHTKKQLPYRTDHPFNGDYPCCQGNYMSVGCVTWQYHVSAESFLHDTAFVKARSKRHLNEVTSCTIYAVDCEMLYTTAGIEVAKVGIVGVDGLTVFESFVLPKNTILDYNTLYSGVSEKDLKGVTTTLEDVQAFLLKLLNKDSILVGHGLENDLKALRLIHEKVVDTSVVFPFPHSKFYKRSLKALAKEFLNKDIQESVNGHDCIEDARTCMELMLFKISTDMKTRLPLKRDENKNIILPTVVVQEPFVPVPYTYNSHHMDLLKENNFFTEFCFPKYFFVK